MVEKGDFRQDLYFRISVIPLSVPPLRERREDIPELAEYFINKFCARSGKNLKLSDEAADVLQNRPWSGNVRELEHTIERAVALSNGGTEIAARYCSDDVSTLRSASVELPTAGLHLPSHLNLIEKHYVAEAMQRSGGNQRRAAELLQIPVHALRHLLGKHEMK